MRSIRLKYISLAAATFVIVLLVLDVPFARASHRDTLLISLQKIEKTFGIESRFGDLQSPSAPPSGPESVPVLNRHLFDHLQIKASVDLTNSDNLLPSRVLERRQGYCVGIAALYLALAERLRLPIHAVATPSHVFLRYDDGTTRLNIETMRAGAGVADEEYIQEQKIPPESIAQGVFMRDLTTDEFLAQVHNNLGVLYSRKRDFKKAAAEYRQALRLDPRLPAAHYNYGSDLLRLGGYRRAERALTRSLSLFPTDVWALNNRGLARMKAGNTEEARGDFEEAVRIDPGFEPARKNLDSLRPVKAGDAAR